MKRSLPSKNGQWVKFTFNHFIDRFHDQSVVAFLENESDRMFYVSHVLRGEDGDTGIKTIFVECPVFINKDCVVLVEVLSPQPVEGEVEEW